MVYLKTKRRLLTCWINSKEYKYDINYRYFMRYFDINFEYIFNNLKGIYLDIKIFVNDCFW